MTQIEIARCAAISIWARSRRRHRRADAGHHQTARARPAVFHRHGSACLSAETGKHAGRRQLQIDGSSLLGMSEGPDIAPSPNAATAPAEPAPAPDRGRFLPLAKIAVFDIAAPLLAYSLLRSAGLSTVNALVLSGILPALGMARDRRVDVVGVLVLLGIAVGTGLGLASGNARLVLLQGSVPTVVFGAVCLGSLWTRRPLMYRFAVDFIGPDTPKGRDFADRWRYPDFRHAFRVTTVVWGWPSWPRRPLGSSSWSRPLPAAP